MRFPDAKVGKRVLVCAGKRRGRFGTISYVPPIRTSENAAGTPVVMPRAITVEFSDGSYEFISPRWLEEVQ